VKPSVQDIVVLSGYANQLRTAIRNSPRQVPNGNRTYNQIMNNATVKMVGTSAHQFNDQCQKFIELYGKNNLTEVAREKGFLDLLP
jgi:hypothetical protein